MKRITQKTLFTFLALLMLSLGNVNATIYTFDGGGQSYSTPANWIGGVVPPNPLPAGDVININRYYCIYDGLTQLTINAGAYLTVNGELFFWPNGLINNGTLNVTLGLGVIGRMEIGNSAIFQNNSLFINDGVFINDGEFNNSGTVINEGWMGLYNGTVNNYASFTNSDTLHSNGTFYNHYSGLLVNNGIFKNGGWFINENILTNNGYFANGWVFQCNDGSLQNGTSGINNDYEIWSNDNSSTTFANLINFASFSQIVPSFSNTGPSIINIESASTQNFDSVVIYLTLYDNASNDQIVLSGDASLTGTTINVALMASYVPALNDSFTLINAASFTNTAATISYPVLPPDMAWETTFFNGDLVIKVVSTLSSISETTLHESLFNVYPNPASDIVNLDIANHSDLELNIYSTTGNLVKSELIKQNQRQVKIDDLCNGIYIVVIKSKEWTEKKKLIIQR